VTYVQIYYTLSEISKFTSKKMPLKEARRRDKDVENRKKALETRTAVTCHFISMHLNLM